MPISIVLGATLFEEVLTGALVAGSIATLINLVIMAISYGKKSFLFPAKSGVIEIVFCSLVTFAHGFLLTYVPGGPTYIISGFSSYSLFSSRCPESAVYLDNDQEFALGSNHY